MGELRGKTAIVTGAASGIGRATAELFADAGARLVLNDVDEERLDRLVETLVDGGAAQVAAVPGDVSDERTAQALTRAAQDRFGAVDILVANAGIIPLVSIDEASAEDWDEVMAIDGRGMFLCCKHAIAAMQHHGRRLDRLRLVDLRRRRARAASRPTGRRSSAPRVDEAPRRGMRQPGHPRQRGRARHDPHRRVLQLADEPGGSEYLDHRRRPAPDGPPRRTSRGRQGDPLPCLRRRGVHHRQPCCPSTADTRRSDPTGHRLASAPRSDAARWIAGRWLGAAVTSCAVARA